MRDIDLMLQGNRRLKIVIAFLVMGVFGSLAYTHYKISTIRMVLVPQFMSGEISLSTSNDIPPSYAQALVLGDVYAFYNWDSSTLLARVNQFGRRMSAKLKDVAYGKMLAVAKTLSEESGHHQSLEVESVEWFGGYAYLVNAHLTQKQPLLKEAFTQPVVIRIEYEMTTGIPKVLFIQHFDTRKEAEMGKANEQQTNEE